MHLPDAVLNDPDLLTGAHFADEAFTENADLESGRHRPSDSLVGMVTERLHGRGRRTSAQ